ncbi:hypothetical protein ACQUF8_14670 [Bacillus subtilis]|uniref:hypothetical protein n=1 Tax=Bacillus subtilis TaxID=1423 RepID=UPI003D18713A
MAKLEGVKTLDMVNGEITKVAYGGAAYERVEGASEVGDIVLITTNGWTDAREGEFYKAVGVDSDGDAKIKDDRGEIDSHFRRNYDIFRKVAAINPSVEERVAKAEGEIESLKSDVAALKGDAEPKPERLKVGDYAKVVNADQHTMDGFSVGDIVEIAESEYGEHDVDFYVMSLAGDNSGYIRKTPEYIVRATDEEVAEAKRVAAEAVERKKWAEIGREVGEYKVGDIFRNPDGILYEVSRIDDRSTFSIRFTDLEGDDDGYTRKANLTLVTPVEARFDC